MESGTCKSGKTAAKPIAVAFNPSHEIGASAPGAFS